MLVLPGKVSMIDSFFLLQSQEYHEKIINNMQQYCWQILNILNDFNMPCQSILSKFLETKYILTRITPDSLHYAENIPNVFLLIKDEFQAHLMGNQANNGNKANATIGNNNGRVKSNSISSNGNETIAVNKGFKFPSFWRSKASSSPVTTNNNATAADQETIEDQQQPEDDNNNNNNSSDSHKQFTLPKRRLTTSLPSSNYYDLTSKELSHFRSIWGIEYSMKMIEAYAVLQRIATVLGWTLEINHFFISMFGNTITFSKLPLRDIVLTQKELINKFLVLANDLYTYACQCNAENQYKWHKNLQMTENELSRVRFHGDKLITVINMIESDHLDYEAQLRRLRDVCTRFQPFMNRVGNSLTNIKEELGLPPPMYTFADFVLAGKNNNNNNNMMLTNGFTGTNDRMLLTNQPPQQPQQQRYNNSNNSSNNNHHDIEVDNPIAVNNNRQQQVVLLSDDEDVCRDRDHEGNRNSQGKINSPRIEFLDEKENNSSHRHLQSSATATAAASSEPRGPDSSAVCIVS